MGSSFRGIYIVYKAEHAFVVGIVMLHRNLNINAIPHSLKIYDIIIKSGFAPVKIGYEFLYTAGIMKFTLYLFLSSFIA